MINGTEIRRARERANLTQEELAERVGVSLRTVGNWERGSSVPRSREGMIRAVLGDHAFGTSEDEPSLSAASDAELIAEVAKRLSRTQQGNASLYEVGRTKDPTQDMLGLAAHKGDPHIGPDELPYE